MESGSVKQLPSGHVMPLQGGKGVRANKYTMKFPTVLIVAFPDWLFAGLLRALTSFQPPTKMFQTVCSCYLMFPWGASGFATFYHHPKKGIFNRTLYLLYKHLIVRLKLHLFGASRDLVSLPVRISSLKKHEKYCNIFNNNNNNSEEKKIKA